MEGEHLHDVYYGDLKLKAKGGPLMVEHSGDNLTGEGDGDDEQIYLYLDRMREYDIGYIAVAITMYRSIRIYIYLN